MKKTCLCFSFVFCLLSCGFHANSQVRGGVRFKVADVEPNYTKQKPAKLESFLPFFLQTKPQFIPDELKNEELLPVWGNGFMACVHTAYDYHVPLTLSPDDIWLMICQGLAIHVNLHYPELKDKLFFHDKPDSLVIRNDGLEYDARAWASLAGGLAKETRRYTRENIYDDFVPAFSTTGPVEVTAFQITLLEAFKQAFQYGAVSGCGIPFITLQGNLEDWQSLKSRLNLLDRFGLQDWHRELDPIADEFIAAYQGKVNKAFWQGMYKEATVYSQTYLSGWVIKLIPYYVQFIPPPSYEFDSNGVYPTGTTTFKANEWMKGNDHLISKLEFDDLPSGLSAVPLHWTLQDKGIEKQMLLHAGFFAMRQYEDASIGPVIGWAVSDRAIPYEISYDEYESQGSDMFIDWGGMSHEPSGWFPTVWTKPSRKARYTPDKLSPEESDAYIKKKLENAIRQDARFASLANDTLGLNFVVTYNGLVTDMRLNDERHPSELADYLESVLANLPDPWLPAYSMPDRMFYEFHRSPNDKEQVVPVNSRMSFVLFEPAQH